jgi:hypothetical protein
MIYNTRIPEAVKSVVGNEETEFVVRSRRANSPKKAISFIAFGTFWLLITSFIAAGVLVPLFSGSEVHVTINDEPAVGSLDNITPILFPVIMSTGFVLIGVFIVGLGLSTLLKKGGYFVGTPTRLIRYRKGNIKSLDWESFTGSIDLSGNNQKGNLKLELRTGKMVSRKNGPDRYVPDDIYISGVPNVFDIEKICRKRIKENDPTPVISS